MFFYIYFWNLLYILRTSEKNSCRLARIKVNFDWEFLTYITETFQFWSNIREKHPTYLKTDSKLWDIQNLTENYTFHMMYQNDILFANFFLFGIYHMFTVPIFEALEIHAFQPTTRILYKKYIDCLEYKFLSRKFLTMIWQWLLVTFCHLQTRILGVTSFSLLYDFYWSLNGPKLICL